MTDAGEELAMLQERVTSAKLFTSLGDIRLRMCMG